MISFYELIFKNKVEETARIRNRYTFASCPRRETGNTLPGGLKAFQCTNFTLSSDIILNTKKIHKQCGSHNGFLTQSMHLSDETEFTNCPDVFAVLHELYFSFSLVVVWQQSIVFTFFKNRIFRTHPSF